MKIDQLYESAAHNAAARHDRPWDRLLARALRPALDRRLADGTPPGLSRALAIRTREIVSPAARRELAESWTHVLRQASREPVPRSPRAPLRRAAVIAAEPCLREMISVLVDGLPVDARGAAMASSLLSDGTGPLYNHRSPVELRTVLREATRQLSAIAARPADEASHHADCWR